MKHLKLENTDHIKFIKKFEQWLRAFGYSKQTVYNLPNHINELFWWLERNGVTIKEVSQQTIDKFYEYICSRPNQRRSGNLSLNQIKKYRQALQLLAEYLFKTSGLKVPIFSIYQPAENSSIEYLSISEIHQLFESIEDTILGNRDKAFLALLYGSGLRRNEVCQLNIDDINREKKTVHVKFGKRYKERIVPIVKKCFDDIDLYLEKSRPELDIKNSKALIITERGTRMSGQAMLIRLNKLCVDAKIKKVGLHSLRHSIATHLLSNGMEMELVAEFLGHESLDSTQIYTHLEQEEHDRF